MQSTLKNSGILDRSGRCYFTNRITFPIRNKQNKLIAFGSLRYHLPYPIATVKKVRVSTVNREDIGVSLDRKGDGEGVMLTGDENIVNVNFEIVWGTIQWI